MLEIEKTYLAKNIPKGLKNCKSIEIIDIYIPSSAENPKLRIRKKGNEYEITKKMILDNDPSKQKEETIKITGQEFDDFKTFAKQIHKLRYYLDYTGKTAEIDVFLGALKGLIVVEFEFNSEKEKDSFEMPDFCLADVTEEKFISGGWLAGKSYREIEKELKRFRYKKIV